MYSFKLGNAWVHEMYELNNMENQQMLFDLFMVLRKPLISVVTLF